MTFIRNTARLASFLAAAALIAGATAPANAAFDPDTAPASKQADKPKLTGRAKSVMICRQENKAPGAEPTCKTRGQWIREGRDPLGVY